MIEPIRPIALADIEAARERIAGTVLRTPLVRLDTGPGGPDIRHRTSVAGVPAVDLAPTLALLGGFDPPLQASGRPLFGILRSGNSYAMAHVLGINDVHGNITGNGLTYKGGEGEVGQAFQTVKQSAALADASRDFKNAISEMRITVKDFAIGPKPQLAAAFSAAESAASSWLNTAASINGMKAADLAAVQVSAEHQVDAVPGRQEREVLGDVGVV